MAVIRWKNDFWRPTEELNRLQNEINNLFDVPDAFPRRGIFDRASSPSLDLVENEDGFTVYCDLPGMDEENLELSVASNVLTIKGERKASKKPNESKVYRNETWSGTFQRTLAIPSPVNADKIEAELKNGMLSVFLPKREEDKPKQIELKIK